MTWLRIDDAWLDSPKVVAATEKGGVLAELLDVRGMAYCARHDTDGFISRSQLSALARGITAAKRRAQALVDAGRWHDADTDCCGPLPGPGWVVHDFLVYNLSRASRDAERDAARERMRKLRAGSSPSPPHPSHPSRVRPNNRRTNGERSPEVTPPVRDPDPVVLSEQLHARETQPVDNPPRGGPPQPAVRDTLRRLLAVPADLEAS